MSRLSAVGRRSLGEGRHCDDIFSGRMSRWSCPEWWMNNFSLHSSQRERGGLLARTSPSLTPEIVLNFRLPSSLAQIFFARCGARSGDGPLRKWWMNNFSLHFHQDITHNHLIKRIVEYCCQKFGGTPGKKLLKNKMVFYKME